MTWTTRHDQPAGELGSIRSRGTVRDDARLAIRDAHAVWVLTADSEWTLARSSTARTFRPEK